VNIRFYIDPETNLPHIYKHGVDESDVEDVLRSPGEDRPGREGSRVAIGQTQADDIYGLFTLLIPNPIASL
jgi:hypothetical protein